MSADRRPLLLAAAVGLAALGSDQLTKALARAEIEPGRPVDLFLGIELVRVSNEGIAFGLLDGAGGLVTVIASAAFALLLVYFALHGERRRLWLPLGLLAGGALGNMIDRLRDGAVTDFIDPPNWPAFNLADVWITLGVAVLLLIFLREPDPK